MCYLLYCRMFKLLAAIGIGSLMDMSAESLHEEAPNRIPRINLDDLSIYCPNIAVKAILIQQKASKTFQNSDVMTTLFSVKIALNSDVNIL